MIGTNLFNFNMGSLHGLYEFFKFHTCLVNFYNFANHIMEVSDMLKNDINVLINKIINYLKISSVFHSYFV